MSADGRISQIMSRFDQIGSVGPDINMPNIDGTAAANAGQQGRPDPKQFKAMMSMMQTQMMGSAFGNDNNDNNSSPFGSGNNNMALMAMLGQSGAAQGNPMAQQMMMQSMMGGGMQGMQGMNPMMGMMGGGMNPMMNPMMMQGMQQPGIQRTENAHFPVEGRVSSPFGMRNHPVHGNQHHGHDHDDTHIHTGSMSFHKGIDIAGNLGDPIKAPWDGEVVFVGHAEGFGDNTVIMAHPQNSQPNGQIMYSIFGHNNSVDVKVGDYVAKGLEFATVGNEGVSTGPHLHWETRVAQPGLYGKEIFKPQMAMAIDPLKFVA